MESERLDFDNIMKERRTAVEQSIRRMSHAELTAIAESLFAKNANHPWKESFDQFLRDNPHETFYYATTNDKLQVIYCPEKEKGIWFLPGSGMGILMQRGRALMKEIIERRS